MKRIAIFAHYDNKNVIQDYVLYYLKELQKVAEKIVFVSDCELNESELSKISPFIANSIAYHHGEYDFGSYKRGYQWAKENGLLEDCEELIFANDSCYGPLFSFEEMFSKMSPKETDFWGVTANPMGCKLVEDRVIDVPQKHIQSYFVVFKSQIFKSDIFDNFINSVKKEHTKEEIVIYYEVGMTKFLLDNGFKYDVYCNLSKNIEASHLYGYKELIKEERCPFLKRNLILFKNTRQVYPLFTKRLVKKYTQYDYNLIETDRRQNISRFKHFCSYVSAFRKFLLRIRLKDRRFCLLGKWYDFSKKMKLGIAYNLFDGEELLEASLNSVRDCADYICVVYQTTSYYGNPASPKLENLLNNLKEKGLIDELYHYHKDFSKITNKHLLEREKRDLGLKLCKKRGMTHFLSMDVDEFYEKEQLERVKNFIAKRKIESTACSIYEYLKDPQYRIIDGCTFQTNGDYNFYCPFIMKINRFGKQKHNSKFFPTLVDPSRAINNSGKFYLFPVQDIVMHHMSTVRKDLDKKYKNSNCNNDSSTKVIEKINKMKDDILSWEFEKTRLNTNKDLAIFNNKIIRKVDNKFGIEIN